ncbi:hypothetical protein [Rhodopirellula europaea]|uniref:hypothetical protein n=1 Tax=Rhodopirellula europaea TaxID=1263866 RepID=UPI003D2C31ED
MSDLFFPQRIELRLDGTDYSPAVLERIVTVGGSSKSFAIAAKMFELLTHQGWHPELTSELQPWSDHSGDAAIKTMAGPSKSSQSYRITDHWTGTPARNDETIRIEQFLTACQHLE